MHFNLHKTFSTPHGGGGPGSGPVGVTEALAQFLPGPIAAILDEGNEDDPPLFGLVNPSHSIGRVKSFHGHFGIIVRAFTYMMMYGSDGLPKIAEYAVLNANYLQARLRDTYTIPYDRICMHEFVVEGHWEDAPGWVRPVDAGGDPGLGRWRLRIDGPGPSPGLWSRSNPGLQSAFLTELRDWRICNGL